MVRRGAVRCRRRGLVDKAVLNPANNEVGRLGWDKIVKIDEPDKYTVVYH